MANPAFMFDTNGQVTYNRFESSEVSSLQYEVLAGGTKQVVVGSVALQTFGAIVVGAGVVGALVVVATGAVVDETFEIYPDRDPDLDSDLDPDLDPEIDLSCEVP